MPVNIDIEEFLAHAGKCSVIDVRSPQEFNHGHIPGAINIPLFSDEERAIVGTIYNHQGREKAMLKALEIIGPALPGKVLELKAFDKGNKILVHCWRGGMRSSSMAWLFELFGYEVNILKGGYKTYRQYSWNFFKSNFKLIVIGGMTGSGKTDLLEELNKQGNQVLNLEKLANHKGSAFGNIGLSDQPTCEQFENNVFEIMSSFNLSEPIFVEDESFSIGKVQVPEALYEKMQNSCIIEIEISKEKRIEKLISEYAIFNKDLLKESIGKIKKRLGNADSASALDAIDNNDFTKATIILLKYYDKKYSEVMNQRHNDKRLYLKLSDNTSENIDSIQKMVKTIYGTC